MTEGNQRRKVVHWKRQGHTEAFFFCDRRGWIESDWDDWKPSTFSFIEIRATNEDFAARVDGCVCV